jgi:hypothetical protein
LSRYFIKDDREELIATWKETQHHSGRCKFQLWCDTISWPLEWLTVKRIKIPDVGENTEQLELFCDAGKSKNSANLGKHFGSVLQSYIYTFCMTQASSKNKNRGHLNFWTQICIVSLCIIARSYEQPIVCQQVKW